MLPCLLLFPELQQLQAACCCYRCVSACLFVMLFNIKQRIHRFCMQHRI